jgi:hypothetical protein
MEQASPEIHMIEDELKLLIRNSLATLFQQHFLPSYQPTWLPSTTSSRNQQPK